MSNKDTDFEPETIRCKFCKRGGYTWKVDGHTHILVNPKSGRAHRCAKLKTSEASEASSKHA